VRDQHVFGLDVTVDQAGGVYGNLAVGRGFQLTDALALDLSVSLGWCDGEYAEWLFGSTDPQAISASLPQAPALLITDGAAPVRWWLGGCGGELPAFAVPVMDTTGAGDAFTAGLLHGLIERPDLLSAATPDQVQELMRWASACGALVCTGAGAIDPQPDAAAVQGFLAQRPRQ
jgi:fructokinase